MRASGCSRVFDTAITFSRLPRSPDDPHRLLMRVLHIAPAIFGENGVVGGAERYSLELAKHMAAEVPTLFAAFGDHARIVPTLFAAFGDHARTEQVGDLPV